MYRYRIVFNRLQDTIEKMISSNEIFMPSQIFIPSKYNHLQDSCVLAVLNNIKDVPFFTDITANALERTMRIVDWYMASINFDLHRAGESTYIISTAALFIAMNIEKIYRVSKHQMKLFGSTESPLTLQICEKIDYFLQLIPKIPIHIIPRYYPSIVDTEKELGHLTEVEKSEFVVLMQNKLDKFHLSIIKYYFFRIKHPIVMAALLVAAVRFLHDIAPFWTEEMVYVLKIQYHDVYHSLIDLCGNILRHNYPEHQEVIPMKNEKVIFVQNAFRELKSICQSNPVQYNNTLISPEILHVAETEYNSLNQN